MGGSAYPQGELTASFFFVSCIILVMPTATNERLPCLLPRVSPPEWRFMRAATRAWTIREAARLSGLSASAACRLARSFYSKGRLRFLFDMRRANLAVLALVTPRLRVSEMPPFTFAVRDVYSMGAYTLVTALIPPPLVDRYVDALGVEPVVAVRGYEYVRWTPESPLARYDPELRAIVPTFELEGAIEECRGPVERWDRGLAAPDVYDLVLLFGRMRDPFARPLRIYREARLVWDPSLPEVSEQVLSYHFTRHLKAMWRGNTAIVFADMRLVPVRIFYFEGRDAPPFARVLCMLPGAFFAAIDSGRAILVAQFPSKYDEHIMRGVEGLDVELVRYFVQSSTDMRGVTPLLWRYVEGRRWAFKEELRVPVVQRPPAKPA